jgi:hypothetical protein
MAQGIDQGASRTPWLDHPRWTIHPEGWFFGLVQSMARARVDNLGEMSSHWNLMNTILQGDSWWRS